jgi:hypothetical protein
MSLKMRVMADERGLKDPCSTTELLTRLRRNFTKRPWLRVVASVTFGRPKWRALASASIKHGADAGVQ